MMIRFTTVVYNILLNADRVVDIFVELRIDSELFPSDPYTTDRHHLLLVSVHFGTISLDGTIRFSYKEAAALHLTPCPLPAEVCASR